MATFIGFDIGRSSTKIVAAHGKERTEILFPSSVRAAITITDEMEAARARKETVLVNNKAYFFGDTAMLQGNDDLDGGLTPDWVYSDEHLALFLGGMEKLRQNGVPDVDTALVVVGLPASMFSSQKAKLSNILTQACPQIEVRVLPQSLGPFHQMMFTVDGKENASVNADQSNWAVIEVGQYTTDYAMLLQGRPVENAFGSCDGMRIAAEQLQRSLRQDQLNLDMVEATNALRTKQVKNFGNLVDVSSQVADAVVPLAQTIVNKSNQLIGGKARELDGVLVAGGGAPLVFPALKKVWPHAQLTDNSRFAVADGFCRFAVAMNNFRASQGKAKSKSTSSEEA